MEGSLSRGYGELKINSGPQAAVAIAGIVAVAGMLVALILAGWSPEAIVGFVVAIAGVAAGQFMNTRKAAEIDAKTDVQTEKIDTIVEQTNGQMRAAISEAVQDGIAKAAAAYRAEQDGWR